MGQKKARFAQWYALDSWYTRRLLSVFIALLKLDRGFIEMTSTSLGICASHVLCVPCAVCYVSLPHECVVSRVDMSCITYRATRVVCCVSWELVGVGIYVGISGCEWESQAGDLLCTGV